MNTDEFKAVKGYYPEALTIWYDRMHDLNKGQLIETLVTHMDQRFLIGLLDIVTNDMNESRKQEEESND